MSGFNQQKYHGRRLDEVVRSVNGDIRSVLDGARPVYVTALSIENSRPGHESYEDVMVPAGYRRVAVLGFDEIWVRHIPSRRARFAGQSGRRMAGRLSRSASSRTLSATAERCQSFGGGADRPAPRA